MTSLLAEAGGDAEQLDETGRYRRLMEKPEI